MNAPTETRTDPTTERSDSLGAELGAGAISLGIALGCLALPLIHFVLGPIGPALGGFFAGQRLRPGFRGVAVVALVTAVGFGLAAWGVVVMFSSFSEGGSPMEATGGGLTERLRDPAIQAIVAAVAAVWALLLAAVGAGLGATFKAKAEERA